MKKKLFAAIGILALVVSGALWAADLSTYTFSAKWTHSSGSPTYLEEAFSTIASLTASTDEVYSHRIEAATGAGSTLGLTHFASVNYAVVINRDGANFVTLTFDDAASDTNTIVIAAGKFAVLPDVDPSATFKIVADTAVVLCDIWVDGS